MTTPRKFAATGGSLPPHTAEPWERGRDGVNPRALPAHTQEPWARGVGGGDSVFATKGDLGRRRLGTFYSPNEVQDRAARQGFQDQASTGADMANAARAVACVNACRGIDGAALEEDMVRRMALALLRTGSDWPLADDVVAAALAVVNAPRLDFTDDSPLEWEEAPGRGVEADTEVEGVRYRVVGLEFDRNALWRLSAVSTGTDDAVGLWTWKLVCFARFGGGKLAPLTPLDSRVQLALEANLSRR